MRIITGIVLFTWCLLFDVSSLFAQGIWKEGEIRFKQSGRDLISVEFVGKEGNICVLGLRIGPSKEKDFSIFYIFPEGESSESGVIIDGKEREVLLKCDKNQVALFIDEKELTLIARE